MPGVISFVTRLWTAPRRTTGRHCHISFLPAAPTANRTPKMTSASARKQIPAADRHQARTSKPLHRMKMAGTPTRRRAGGGLTLIELLLTLVLLLLLLGSLVLNFTGLQSGVQLDEGGEQFKSLIRYARAHAANTGCRVRLSFEELIDEDLTVPLGNVFVSWEPEPLQHPGQFQPLAQLSPLVESLLGLVEVDDVRPLGIATTPRPDHSTELTPEGEGGAGFAPIMFYPDGSSDSA